MGSENRIRVNDFSSKHFIYSTTDRLHWRKKIVGDNIKSARNLCFAKDSVFSALAGVLWGDISFRREKRAGQNGIKLSGAITLL